MIKISETNYDYIFDNGQFSLIISKNTWKQLPQSKPDDVLKDGDATVVFSKTSNGIKIQKTFRGKQLVLNLDEKTWEYIKKWVRCPEKRDELTAEYKEKSEQNRKIKFEEEVKKQQESKKAWMDNSGFNSYMDAVHKYGNYHEQKQNVVIDVLNDADLPF